VDAHTLAQLLRADLLPEAWIAPQQVRDQRALLRHRAWLGRIVTAAKCRVHAVLADRGVQLTERLWTTAGRAWLADLALPAIQRTLLARSFHILKGVATPATGEGHHTGCARDVACA
jgi:transposase